MSRVVYVNGQYRPYADAAIHVEDRGFQFADAIYEVIEVLDGRLIDEARHMERLERSLREIKMAMPMSRAALAHVVRETIRRNRVANGLVYLQVSRGTSPRDFLFPSADVPPTLVVVARRQMPERIAETAATGIEVKTMPDIRWGRSDIKTVMLLPAALAKNAAKADGAREVWFVDGDGKVTEGASSNAWIVKNGTLITRQLDSRILPGITRMSTLDAIKGCQLKLEERAFSPTEAYAADEAFITSATNTVMPVVKIDGNVIGSGQPGAITRQLRAAFHQFAQKADT